MIELKLIRKNPKDINQEYTHGELFIRMSKGEWKDFCYTLEDRVKDYNKDGDLNDEGEKKVYGETAIPFGKYDIEVTWSPKFKRNMVLIKDVPEFSGIRIHGGNTKDNTFGCPLVAYQTDWKGKIWKTAEHDLTKIVQENGGKGTIEII